MSLDTLLPQLGDPARLPSATQLTALSRLTGADRDRFLDAWRGLSIQRRRDLIDRLADLAEDNVDLDYNAVFMLGLFDDDVQVRADSIRALWEYEAEDLVPVLQRLLGDPEAIVRAEAALGLGRFLLRWELIGREDEFTREAEASLRAVFGDPNELSDVRGRALEALGVRSHEWVAGLIRDAYDGSDRRLAISAVHAMGRNADPAWLGIIEDEMASDDPEMRFEAAVAAGSIGDEQAVSALAGLTGDEDVEVQEAAISALGQIGGAAARSVLHSVASEHADNRILEAVRDALAEADFVEDPLAFKLYADDSVAEDLEDEDEDL